MKKLNINKKAIKFGALSTVITAAFLAAVIMVNLIATILVDRFNIRFDLTNEAIFTLDDKTKDILSKLETGVDIYVTLDEVYFTQSSDSRDKHVKYLLDEFELGSKGNISVTYDSELINNQDFIGSFSYINLKSGDIVVVSRNQPDDGKITNYRRFSLDDCFTQTTYSSYTYDISKVENNILAAIKYLNQDEIVTVAYTTGHDEIDVDESLSSLIKSNVFDTSSVNLQMLASEYYAAEATDGEAEEEEEEEILTPEEKLAQISVIVIYCPKRDFSEEELSMLDIYLENGERLGKGLMVFFEATTPELPNLEAFLAEWGVTVGDGMIYDEERNYMGTGAAPRVYMSTQVNSDIPVFSNELYNSIADAKLNICAPVCRPLYIVDGYGYDSENKTGGTYGIITYKAITSFNTSTIMVLGEEDTEQKPASHIVGTVSVKQRVIDSSALYSSVSVFGTNEFVTEQMLTNSVFANDQVFVELLNYQAQRDTGIIISAEDITTATLTVTATQTFIIIGVFVVTLPLLAIIMAVVVFIRRRHL